VSENQLSLFNTRPAYRVEQEQELMSQEALQSWKLKIFNHQQKTLNTEPPYAKRYPLGQQLGLFDAPASHCDVDTINPFELKLHSSQFYRMKEIGDAVCIYFIIDNTLPALRWRDKTIS
jgi:hypothetical protein